MFTKYNYIYCMIIVSDESITTWQLCSVFYVLFRFTLIWIRVPTYLYLLFVDESSCLFLYYLSSLIFLFIILRIPCLTNWHRCRDTLPPVCLLGCTTNGHYSLHYWIENFQDLTGIILNFIMSFFTTFI